MRVENLVPKIVLALGGGGARGFAHIGVLQVFKEADIKIWGIAGTSMGAMVGATYAVGADLYYLERLIDYLKWEDLVDIRFPRLGLIDGSKVQTLIDILTKNKRFEDLSKKFWAVATDLFSGEEIVFKTGPIAPAIRASISIPGVFNPVELNGRVMVDGAVVAGVPVKVALQMGGDLVIAVNVGFDHTAHQVNNVFDVLSKVIDIMGNQLDAFQIRLADLIIKPQLGSIGTMNFGQARECVNIGRKAAEASLPQLRNLIEAKTPRMVEDKLS
jgi:NTE family protein